MAKERGNQRQFWQYTEQKKRRLMGRRRFLRGTALSGIGLAATMLIGCGQERQATLTTVSDAQAQQPKRGGILSHQSSNDTLGSHLDPHRGSRLATQVWGLFYQGLVAYNLRTLDVEPELAQRWEQPSETEYIFTLGQGIRWQNRPPANGRLLTAQDVVFSLQRAQTNDPQFTTRSLLIGVDKIEAVDNVRVRLTTRAPDAALLMRLSADLMKILNPETVEKAGGNFNTIDVAIGTGPFIITNLQEGIASEYVRNPDYWKPGLPYLDGFRSVHFANDEVAYAAFLAGRVDVTRIPGSEVKKYIAQQGPGYTPDWAKSDAGTYYFANVRVPPMNDRRVTKALRLLIDHDEAIRAWAEVWTGRGRYGSIFPASLEAWDLTEEEYRTFLEYKQPKDDAIGEALALLSAAGFTRQNPLRFELSNQVNRAGDQGDAAAQLLEAQWRQLSQGVVQVTIRQLDAPTANTVRSRGDFVFFSGGGLSGNANEPDSYLSQAYRTGGSRNLTGFSDPSLDAIIDRQRVTFDINQRKAIIKEALRYLIENGPSTVPANLYNLNAVNRRVRDHTPEQYLVGTQYQYVWLDS